MEAGSRSCNVTAKPDMAATAAISPPIVPAPMTWMRVMADSPRAPFFTASFNWKVRRNPAEAGVIMSLENSFVSFFIRLFLFI